mgnify:CR=1 FL=1
MKNETMYFNDLLSIWLEKQKQARALSTYVKYRHLADRYISPYFRSIQLSKVDLPLLQTFRNSLLSPDSLHPLGNGTIRCIPFCVFPMKPGRQTAFSISRPVFQKSALKYLFLPFRNRNSSNTI